MPQSAHKRSTEPTASIRPIRPLVKQRIEQFDADDQLAALFHEDDVLAKQIARLQSSTKASAADLAQQVDRASRDAHIAHSLAAQVRRDHRQLAQTVEGQTTTLKQHRAALDHQAQYMAGLRAELEALQQEVGDNHLLAASQDNLDALRSLVDQLEVRENSTHSLAQGLAKQVSHFATEIRRLRETRAQAPASAPVRMPRVEKPKSGSLLLKLSYGVVSFAFVAALIYSILPH